MAKFEVVVREVTPTPEEIKQNPEQSGIPLATILERTGGSYIWQYAPDKLMREGWLKTSRATEGKELEEIANAAFIPISLEHLKGRDPVTTRIKVAFEVQYESIDEAVKAGAVDNRNP